MGELTNRVSNGPDSFFYGKAVALEGRGDGRWCLITCGGRGEEWQSQSGRLSITELRDKKRKWENSPTG
jgi:hypothetical protein